MSQNEEQERGMQKSARMARIALLTLTTVGPIIKTIAGRMQQRAQAGRQAALERGSELVEAGQETAQGAQVALERRLGEFTAASRQIASEQARQLQKQARQLQEQTKMLRRALRAEASQRKQLQKVTREAQRRGAAWSRELLSRGEELTSNLLAQGGKISQDVIERGSAVTHDLAERGERLLRPVRKQNRTFWTAVGFGIGLMAAATATYVLIRRRQAAVADEQDEQIELPAHGVNGASQSRPVGEIRRVEGDGAAVATAQKVAAPAGAAFVGLKSTNRYYTLADFNEQFAQAEGDDLVYFASADEAREQGYTAM
jgi:hypothetical protein